VRRGFSRALSRVRGVVRLRRGHSLLLGDQDRHNLHSRPNEGLAAAGAGGPDVHLLYILLLPEEIGQVSLLTEARELVAVGGPLV